MVNPSSLKHEPEIKICTFFHVQDMFKTFQPPTLTWIHFATLSVSVIFLHMSSHQNISMLESGHLSMFLIAMPWTRYRMHPSIRSFPSSQFYESMLEDQVSIPHRPQLDCIWPQKKEPAPQTKYGIVLLSRCELEWYCLESNYL